MLPVPRAKHAPRILLVNGENTVQHLRALMLRMEGYHVDTAADLRAARAVISAERKYDLVIVDVGHFAAPGLAFCEEIKTRYPAFRYPALKVLMQVDGSVFIDPASCPDEVVSKQEEPQHFVREVERMLQAS
jgi:CheY-like chemotaxis protein